MGLLMLYFVRENFFILEDGMDTPSIKQTCLFCFGNWASMVENGGKREREREARLSQVSRLLHRSEDGAQFKMKGRAARGCIDSLF